MTNNEHTEKIERAELLRDWQLAVECAKDTPNTGRQILRSKTVLHIAALLAADKAGGEVVYQYKRADGSWIDQTKTSYDYNVKYGVSDVRVVYTQPQPQPCALQDDVAKDAELTEDQAVALFRKHGIFLYPMRPGQCLALVRDAAMLKDEK